MFRRTTLIGTVAALVAGIAASEPAPASADIHISPALACVTFNATVADRELPLVGVNADRIIENIVVSDSNYFDPIPS